MVWKRGLLGEQVAALMGRYLSKFQLAPRFTEEEVEHYLMPVADVIDSHVVEAPSEFPSTLPVSQKLAC